MTTIAWDGKALVGDTKVTFGNLVGSCVKTAKLEDGRLLGSTGVAEDHVQVKAWLEAGGLRGARENDPKQPMLDKDYNGILIDADGAWVIQANLMRWPLPGAKWAIGSGRDFAVAAMHLGCDARKAIEVAKLFDVYTGGEVTSVAL